MQQGFAVWQANGQELGKPFWLALLGEGYARVGQVAEGLQVLDEAMAMAQTRELRVWEAELNRLQGEVLLQQAVGGRRRVLSCHPPPSTGRDVWAMDPSRLFIRQKPAFVRPWRSPTNSKPNHWSCGRP